MTLLLALRTVDGLVAAADARAVSPDRYTRDAIRRLGSTSRGLVVARTLEDRVFVGASGSLELLQRLDDYLAELSTPPPPLPDLVRLLQDLIVRFRIEATRRYHDMYSSQVDGRILPTLRLLVAGLDEDQPRLVYLSESGDIEDRTGTGHEVIGSAELYGHLHLKHFPLHDIDARTGLLILHAVATDASSQETWDVEAPPQLWRLDASTGRWHHLEAAEVNALDEAHARLQGLVRDALVSVSAAGSGGTP